MENVNDNQTLDNTNAFFSDYFTDIDLNKDIEMLYQIIGTEDSQDEFEESIKLTKLRDENHKRYHDIDTLKYEDLPDNIYEYLEDMFDLYSYIDAKKILTADLNESNNIKLLLDNIYRRKDRLDRVIKAYLKQITKSNDEKQAKFSINYFKTLNIDEELKKELLEKYNDLVLFSSNFNNSALLLQQIII